MDKLKCAVCGSALRIDVSDGYCEVYCPACRVGIGSSTSNEVVLCLLIANK